MSHMVQTLVFKPMINFFPSKPISNLFYYFQPSLKLYSENIYPAPQKSYLKIQEKLQFLENFYR